MGLPIQTLLCVLMALACLGPAQAATKTSTGSGSWGTNGTWTPSGVPASGDDVIIANTHVVTLNVNTNNLRTLTINAGGTLRGDNTNKSLNITGNTGGNDFVNNGTLNFGAGFLATYVLQNGNRLSGNGGSWTFSVLNHSNRTLTFAAGSSMTLNFSGAATPFPGTGTITSLATVTWNFTGTTAQTLSTDTGTTYGIVRISNTSAGGVTLGVALTAARILDDLTVETGAILNNGGLAIAGNGTATFTVQNGARFNLTGTTGMPTGFGTFSLGPTSTTSFQGGNQTIATTMTYGHVIAQGGSTKTPATGTLSIAGDLTIETGTTFTANSNDPTINVTGSMAINGTGNYTASSNAARPLSVTGDFSVAGTYTGSVAPLNVAGDFTRTGTFTSSTGLVTLNGTAATAQSFTGATTITNLAINNTGSPGGVTLNNDITVGTLLTLTSGVVTTGSNTVITSANCPGSISRSGGHINGNLQLRFNTGAQACTYHVGDSTAANYTPVLVTFTNVSAVGSLIGGANAGDYADTGTPIDTAHSVNRSWTLALPGAGALSFTGSYSTAFTYLSGDNDPGNTASAYVIARGTSCSPLCTWALQTISGTPSTTAATATGITTSFGVFVIGRRRVAQFGISVPGGTVSTCNAASVTITAQDGGGATATNYTGTVNISTSTSDGDWALTTGNGILTNAAGGASGAADDGLATYAFNALDLGVVTLSLSNVKVNSNVTITVVDNANGSTSSNSSAIQFSGNDFRITNDAIQVAGRNQTMTVARNRGASCVETLTEYAGSKGLKAWYTADADQPSGAAAPAITGASPAITTSTPGANNLTLSFASGSATFTLTTTDVGKYIINLRDDAVGTVDGASPTITTRPFALVVSAIHGSINNLGGNATSGSKFIAASDTFQATVGAYKWNAAADGGIGSDGLPGVGVPDVGATLAQIIGAGAAPSYRWATTLSAASPFTPVTGSLAALSNGTQTGACPTGSPNCFTSGVATPTNLSYPEVGSFTLAANATNFLSSGINLTAIVFDNSATPARNAVVGRFYPDHFTLTASSLTAACAGGSFTYMGQPNLGYTFGIEARNKSDVKTGNYINAVYNTGAVSLQAENANSGTDLGTSLSAPTASWSAGAYSFSTSTATFTRPATPVGAPGGPFDSLQIGVTVTDADGPVLAARDMNPTTTGACVPATTCTGKSIGTTIVRFGRLTIGNASGSAALPLTMPIEAQYWNGNAFITNTLDACTSVLGSDVAMGIYSTGLNPAPTCKTAVSNGGALTSGRRPLRLSAPTGQASGNVTLTVNLGAAPSGNTCTTAGALPGTATTANRAYLQSGSGFSQNPSGRATFGVYRGSEDQIHRQENF
jgi:hypothetical protein